MGAANVHHWLGWGLHKLLLHGVLQLLLHVGRLLLHVHNNNRLLHMHSSRLLRIVPAAKYKHTPLPAHPIGSSECVGTPRLVRITMFRWGDLSRHRVHLYHKMIRGAQLGAVGLWTYTGAGIALTLTLFLFLFLSLTGCSGTVVRTWVGASH